MACWLLGASVHRGPRRECVGIAAGSQRALRAVSPSAKIIAAVKSGTKCWVSSIRRAGLQPFKPVSAMFSIMRRRISRNTISIGTTLTTEPAISLPVSLLKANWKVVSPNSMLNSD
jgi:hypothetical protein